MKTNRDIHVDFWETGIHRGLFYSQTRYQKFHFEKHFHNYYTIILIESGINEGFTDDIKYKIGKGSVLIINPGELHAGSSFGEKNLQFKSLIFAKKFLEQICAALEIEVNSDIVLENKPIDDPRLTHILANLFERSTKGFNSNEVQHFVLLLFNYLLSSFWKNGKASKGILPKLYLQRALDYIVANYKSDFSLSELAMYSGVSECHLLREFKKEMRLTPFQFLRNFRIEQSKNHLSSEKQIVGVALDMGFFDNSHFTRSFYGSTGILPSNFRAIKPRDFEF